MSGKMRNDQSQGWVETVSPLSSTGESVTVVLTVDIRSDVGHTLGVSALNPQVKERLTWALVDALLTEDPSALDELKERG